jgi:hypothetical protein
MSPLYRATADRYRTAHRAAADLYRSTCRATGDLYRTTYRATSDRYRTTYQATADFSVKHSRISVIAASAATAGVLATAGFAAGAAPWAQAFDNAAASGQPGSAVVAAITGTQPHASQPLAGGQLDAIRSAKAAGNAGQASAAGKSAAAAFTQHAPGQAARQQAAAKQQAVAKQQAAAKQKSAQQQAARARAAKAAAAKRAAKSRAHAAPASSYLMYDSVKPKTIPNGKAAAVYANGAYAASSSQVSGHNSVLWIDTNGSDPGANVLDVEPGDATPLGAAQWVQHRLSSQPHSVAIVYTMRSEWQQVKDNVGHLPGWMQSKVRYWIADPTGVPHVVPGSNATQWYWGNNYDITTANPNFKN